MHFDKYVLQQIERHPSMQPQDLIKLCYQAAFGAEHLLADRKAAREYLEQEFQSVCECAEAERDCLKAEPLLEPISEYYLRVNLRPWGAKGMPIEWLFRMFAASAGNYPDMTGLSGISQRDLFTEYLRKGTEFVEEKGKKFLETYLQSCGTKGPMAVHHSRQYRDAEKPAYRLINRKYEKLMPILEQLAFKRKKTGKDVHVIAIDGRAGAGKTTLAAALQEILGAEVVQMDDFFLPPDLRTPERLAQPGGNVHYERFREEVLPWLSESSSFSYKIFDCGKMDYFGNRRIESSAIRIVEGSYSCHPALGDYADVKVFVDVEPEEQMVRIMKRNGSRMAEMFRERWIPLEEEYFKNNHICEKADVILRCI